MMASLSNTLSAWWPEPLRLVLFLVGILAFVGLNAAYLVWVERKGAARFQRRPGCSLARPRSAITATEGMRL